MKILFLTYHWLTNSHHSKYGGFHQIIIHAAKEHDVCVVTYGDADASYKDEHGITNVIVKGPKKDRLFLRRFSISRMGKRLARDFDVVHALHEDCVFFLEPNSFTCTFHVMPGIVFYKQLKHRIFLFLKDQVFLKKAMRNARNIGCVSTNLLEALPEQYRGKSSYIPHGIDIGYWDPALADPGEEDRCDVLCVGSHGVDAEVLRQFIVANPSSRFVMVGMKESLGDFSNVTYLRGVSDDRLRNLYQGAMCMMRPLTFATANNSLLEAIAMGRTVVASRIPGVTDYLDDASCIFLDTLKDFSLEAIRARQLDPAGVRAYAAKHFSWETVLGAYLNLYKS